MTQADDKKSELYPLLPGDSPVSISGLPDARTIESSTQSEAIPFPVVGIGASAGGVEALRRLFKSLPVDKDIAYIVVMHLAPDHPSHLADILAKTTSMPVVQITEELPVEPNTVYVISPNHYLILDSGYLRLEQIPQPRPIHKVIDVLFTSLAEEQQERAICIVLTGGDHDGTIGLKAIKAAGGMAMAQAPQTAQHPSMPESAINTGLVDHILPIEEMGQTLTQYIDHSGLWGCKPASVSAEEVHTLRNIVALLRTHAGVDFRGYKEGMLMRRTKRRMVLRRFENLGAYFNYLQNTPEEIRTLTDDLLINVTEFFREPQAWQALEENVLPRILDNHEPDEPIRAWVAGCATGEEAYSLGIALLELLQKAGLKIAVNIIASDLDHPALEVARAGIYPESITNVLNPELLSRYFTRLDGNRFKVRKVLRESILFSQHNLIADPPFSRMDLISCRNLLIYMKPEVQEQLLQMFHFALKPQGYLFLGKSETGAAHHGLFTPVSKLFRLYQTVDAVRKQPVILPIVPDTSTTRVGTESGRGAQPRRMEYGELVRELLLRQRLATAVLIDRDSQVLYFYGPTKDFLAQPEGAVTRDLLSMVSDRMRLALRAVIQSARNEGKPSEFILECPPGEHRQLRVRAIKADREQSGLILVAFEYESLNSPVNQADSESLARQQLQDDLRTTQLNLESSLQALEATNVELHIINEEAMSMNEELQSANEELETSKEELQSINEELATVNSDLERSVKGLRTANDDLLNLLASNDLPTLFLDGELHIKRFTPASLSLFRLIPSDIGRPIGDFALKIEPQDLEAVARQVLDSGVAVEAEAHTPERNFYLRRVLPYCTEENRIEGVVVTFIPIDELRQAQHEIRESEKRFRILANTAPVFIWISGLGGRLEFVNRRFVDETGKTDEELLGTGWHSFVHASDLPGYLAACSSAETAGKGYDYELRLRKADGGYNWMRFVGEPRFERERLVGFIGSTVDIQYHKNAEEQLRNADRRKDEFLAILGHELRNPLSPIRNAAQALQFVDSGDKRLSWARQTIIRQVDHMARLVDDLLDIARLTRGTLTLRKETVDMAVIVHHALESTKTLVDTRKHSLTVEIKDEPLFVDGDPVRLTQIIENLLTNAAKFTEEGGKILLNYETVKYFNNESWEAQRYDAHMQKWEIAAVRNQTSLAALNSAQSAIIAIGVTLLLLLAAEGVIDGSMTLGDLVLVNAFMLQLYMPLHFLGFVYREIKHSLADMEKMFSLLAENEEIKDKPDATDLIPGEAPLRFEGVNFSYEPNRQILFDVSFHIPAGRNVAVVGHSGSGKSTLARLLFRFYDVTTGRILINDQDISSVTQKSLRKAVGIVPQDTVLFNDSIYYNIAYGRPDASREEIFEAARAAHIHDFIESLPDKYETTVGERGLKLSGGEKQRVAIARAILKKPEILICDEATSALDSKSEKAIQAELKRIAVNRTTLTIAHRLSTIADADQILVMNKGRIIERGTHRELLALKGTYAHMWELQQQEEQTRLQRADDLQGALGMARAIKSSDA